MDVSDGGGGRGKQRAFPLDPLFKWDPNATIKDINIDS